MNIVDESLPQVLLAKHLYSPLWFLLMLVIFNSFPKMTSLVSTIFQKTIREGVPAVTLHSFVTCPPSSTVIFSTCSIAGGSRRHIFMWFVTNLSFYTLSSKMQMLCIPVLLSIYNLLKMHWNALNNVCGGWQLWSFFRKRQDGRF